MQSARAEQSPSRVSLHIGNSLSHAWAEIIRPWFQSVAAESYRHKATVAVVTPHRSLAYSLRSELLNSGIGLLGVHFFLPPHLREFVLRSDGLEVPAREDLRLLLSIAAQDVAESDPGKTNQVQLARAVARDPEQFLRTLDQLYGAGYGSNELESSSLARIGSQYENLVQKCGLTLIPDLDRKTGTGASERPPIFGRLLIVGFDGMHWPLWPLLDSITDRSAETTVVLTNPRDEARDMDQIWIGTWEQKHGPANPIAGDETSGSFSFGELLQDRPRNSKPDRHLAAAAENVHFLIGQDTSEQAQAIAALTIGFLNQSSCRRLAILLPGNGALARLVATTLEKLRVPHHDGIAHQRRGVFDDEEWRAWLELQQQPRLGRLLQFLNHSSAAIKFFSPLSMRQVSDTLQRACGDILINAAAVLREYCGRRVDELTYVKVGEGLGRLGFLPERATLDQFLKQTHAVFTSLNWSERSAELRRFATQWNDEFNPNLTRDHFVRWLTDIFAEPSLSRDPFGDHPYAPVQLLRYTEAESQNWSHVILAGLNEGVWPPRDDESPFLPDDTVSRLNERNKQQSRFGEGQLVVREATTLLLGSRERRAAALRQLRNVIENTSAGIAVTAERYTYSPREQPINPSEFFARLFFAARGETLSQQAISRIHDQTRQWLGRQDFLRSDIIDVGDAGRTAAAYRARRNDAPFGEYEFSFRDQVPPRPISLSATDIGNALKRPALIWMKAFLGLNGEEVGGGSWNLATGQWVHRWLAKIGAERQNDFVDRPEAGELVHRVTSAADEFHNQVQAILRQCERPFPDWWTSGWQNARFLAQQFAGQIAAVSDWPFLATEWKLVSPQTISLGNGKDLRVRGRIDLILRRGEPETEFWIVDYKTGEAKPLNSKPADLRRQLAAGDGIQICIYLLALRDRATNIYASLLTRGSDLQMQVETNDVIAQSEIWMEIARIQDTGTFGLLGELRSDYAFTGTYPLATLGIDKELLRKKWERTHPAFAKSRQK